MNLLIVAADTYLPLYVLQCLHGPEVHIYILGAEKAPPVRFSRYCKGYLRCSKNDILDPTPEYIKTINNYCKKNCIDVIIPTGIDETFFVSKIQDKIKYSKIFPVSSLATLQTLNNKYTFLHLLKRYSLPHPKSFALRKLSEIEKIRNYPIIIKPFEMSSGLGVKKINNLYQLRQYLDRKGEYNSLPLLIQEYVKGHDVDISLLATNGNIVVWTIQRTNPNGSITFIENNDILKLATTIIIKIKYSGVAHLDMRYDRNSKSVKVIEFNPRFWGTVLASKKAGVNFVGLGLQLALDQPIPIIKYRKNSYITSKNILRNLLTKTSHQGFLKRLANSDFKEIAMDPLPTLFLFAKENYSRLRNLFNLYNGF